MYNVSDRNDIVPLFLPVSSDRDVSRICAASSLGMFVFHVHMVGCWHFQRLVTTLRSMYPSCCHIRESECCCFAGDVCVLMVDVSRLSVAFVSYQGSCFFVFGEFVIAPVVFFLLVLLVVFYAVSF